MGLKDCQTMQRTCYFLVLNKKVTKEVSIGKALKTRGARHTTPLKSASFRSFLAETRKEHINLGATGRQKKLGSPQTATTPSKAPVSRQTLPKYSQRGAARAQVI